MPKFAIEDAKSPQFTIEDEGQGSTPDYGPDVRVENPSFMDLVKGAGKGLVNTVSDLGGAQATGGFYPANIAKVPSSGIHLEPNNFGQRMGYGAEKFLEPFAMLPTGIEAGEALPSTVRAANTIQDITSAAKNVEVPFSAARTAMQNFGEETAAGLPSKNVMNKFARRLNPPEPRLNQLQQMQADLSGESAPMAREPINFPEARRFYKNVSRTTAKPSFLRAQLENPQNPDYRRVAGIVRNAMHQDLTDAAETIGRGQEYADAVREYANAARLNEMAKKVTKYAVPAAVGAAGLGAGYGLIRPFIP